VDLARLHGDVDEADEAVLRQLRLILVGVVGPGGAAAGLALARAGPRRRRGAGARRHAHARPAAAEAAARLRHAHARAGAARTLTLPRPAAHQRRVGPRLEDVELVGVEHLRRAGDVGGVLALHLREGLLH